MHGRFKTCDIRLNTVLKTDISLRQYKYCNIYCINCIKSKKSKKVVKQ